MAGLITMIVSIAAIVAVVMWALEDPADFGLTIIFGAAGFGALWVIFWVLDRMGWLD